MNREKYLKELKHYLRKLPKEDYENAMDYFTEYFDEAGPEREEEVIRELGTPREAASEVLNELLTPSNLPVAYRNPDERGDSSAGRIILIAVLAILAAPIGIPLGIGAISVLFAGVITVAAVFATVVALGLATIFTGCWFIYQSFLLLAESLSAGVLLIGSGLLVIGLGLLAALFAIWAGKQMIFGLARLISRLIRKKGGNDHE